MSQKTKTLRRIPQTTLRRLRITPTYFFLIWRWSTWLYALIWIVLIQPQPMTVAVLLLIITFLQTAIVTLYAPVFKIFLPNLSLPGRLRLPGQSKQQPGKRKQGRIWSRRRPRPLAADEEADILPPLIRTRKPNRDIIIYGLDVVICGLVTYYSGHWGYPPFGASSPFYRYGLSSIFAAAFTYRYRGGLTAAFGYELFMLLGAFFPPPGTPHYVPVVQDLQGSLIDAPLIAILFAYLATLLNSYTRNKRREQDSVRRQKALLRVGESLVTGASDRQHLLQQSVKQIRQGGHFEYLIIAIIKYGEDVKNPHPQIDTFVESGLVESTPTVKSEALIDRVAQSGEKLTTFEPLNREEQEEPIGLARLYLPFKKEGQVYMVLGADMSRKIPFDERQETFLIIVGTQLIIALENMLLTEQAADLAAAAERGRIAREIHDGIAQLIYMLSLNSETCAALLKRIADASTEEALMLAPVAERLDKLVTISKQALWETRHYMFTLKPLMSGTTTLTQMLTTQLREFEAISGLPAHLEVEGSEVSPNGDQGRTRKMAQVGTAIFRITQEALTNAYKHAEATEVQVHLRYLPRCIEVEISDDGKGLNTAPHGYDLGADGEQQRIYSGHGMRGMHERAEELGGTFQVRQEPSGGASVLARIPI
jgi:signal transduction histidine kinase